ncbi:MAG: TRAP transporter substrate-binding protein [Syntrophaceae bacterium]|nr:TRAP transporter substrate-binding protein [Syntrophaceae bacterium]
MEKKWLVLLICLGISIGFISSPGMAEDKPKTIKLKMQYFFPKGHPATVNSQDYYCNMVNKLSNGRLKITSHGSDELVPTFEMGNAVGKGTIDMASWTPYFDMGKEPVGAIMGVLPFGFTEHDYMVWYYEAGGKEYIQKMYDKYNIHVIGPWISFGQLAGMSKKSIESLADMEGKVYRNTGLPAKILTELGVCTTILPPGELYTALERGTVDILEFSTPSVNYAFGLHEVGKYVILPGWQEPSTLLLNIINKDTWDKIPDDLKYIMEIATDAEYRKYATFAAYDDAVAWKKMLDYGCVTNRLPDADLAKLSKATDKVLQGYADADPFFAEVWKSQKDFLAKMKPYRTLCNLDYKE